MAEQGVTFTKRTATRILAATKGFERLPRGEFSRRRRYVTSNASSDWFPAIINSATQVGSNFRWTYSFSEAEKTSAGYGGWTAKSGGTTGTAYNFIEDQNGATGVF